jgi:hypothetical protein
MKKLFAVFLLFAFGTIHAQNINTFEIPKAVSDYVAKKYPKADSIQYSKEMYKYGRWIGEYKYTVSFNIKNQKMSLDIFEDGKPISLTKDIPIKKIPAFAHKYIEKHYKNANILKAQRKSFYMSREKFYCIFISSEWSLEWKGIEEPVVRETWVDFNRKKEYIGRINEI